MIYLYTGEGEGKTSAALGHILRALGYNKKVLLIQFMKARETGEITFLRKLGIPVYQFGKKEFVDELDDTYISLIKQGWNLFKREHSNYELIVLDEFAYVCSKNIFSKNELQFLKKVPSDIIITGRNAPKFLVEISDLVSEIKKIKHPYDKGVLAIKGLDF